MEMRASDGMPMGEEITLPIPPLAFSLFDPCLRSHCSACFGLLQRAIPQNTPDNTHNPYHIPRPSPLSCNSHCNSVFYCSLDCLEADEDHHRSSGECHLFHLIQSDTATRPLEDISDLRAALRLLFCFEKLGFLSPQTGFLLPRRIGGLMSNREKFDDSETLEGIRDGAMIISRARRMRDGLAVLEGERGERSIEETSLCMVLTNAVEVQVDGGRTLGIAVYGPDFSWFNHSCTANACYRFSVTRSTEPGSREAGSRVLPCGEEATAVRHSELFLKYRFVCCCERCISSPTTNVDLVLEENAADDSNSSSDNNKYRETYDKLNDCLEQAITEYMSAGNPEACCERLENMLIENSKTEPSSNFKLHPLHHVSLNAYMTLASAYRFRARGLLALYSGEDNQSKAFQLSKAGAAYSLLLAGAVHHLFLVESSLIASVANFWISAGESLLGLVRSSKWGSIIKNGYDSDFSSVSVNSSLLMELEVDLHFRESHIPRDRTQSLDFDRTCKHFLASISRMSSKVWYFLIHGLPYLKNVKDPVDFTWLQLPSHGHKGEAKVLVGACSANEVHEYGADKFIGEETLWTDLIQFSSHCLLYGGYLASVCYGLNHYLIDHVRNLLCSENCGECSL